MTRPFFAALALSSSIVLLGTAGSAQQFPSQEFPYALFERYIEPLRQQSGIPGMSAAVVREGRIEWERGFGHQDVEQVIAATPDTPYPIGGVTQSFTAVLLGICTDRHRVEVDDPIRKSVPTFPEPTAPTRHVMAHASDAPPGSHFRYDPTLYLALTPVAEACSSRAFRVALADEILDRLGMSSSVPSLDVTASPARDLFDSPRLARYNDLLRRVATPYRIDRGRVVKSENPSMGLDASTGLISTVRDLARFDTALDAGVPMSTFTLSQMWSPASFGTSPTLPTGLGWFVQNYGAIRVVWSFGLIPDAGSAIIVKIPSKRLTLYMLANSPGLTAGTNLEQGDANTSAFIKIFLRLFG
jgi:CubicO group peptidase (beta-lactamase class C family)